MELCKAVPAYFMAFYSKLVIYRYNIKNNKLNPWKNCQENILLFIKLYII